MGEHPTFTAGLEDGYPVAAGWADYWTTLTLPLAGTDLDQARATLAAWSDPANQDGDGDCLHCAQQVRRLARLVKEGS
jgi:hypothetical protein